MSTKLPTYFKDETGFCYTATDALATLPGMTPWDGDVDENGFAVDAVEAEKPAPAAAANKGAKRGSAPKQAQEPEVTPEPEVVPEPEQPAVE